MTLEAAAGEVWGLTWHARSSDVHRPTGGELGIESSEAEGTTFTLTTPARHD